MTQEDKQLLLKDLSSRVIPNTKVRVIGDWFYEEREPYDSILTFMIMKTFEENDNLSLVVKPYLRPMSSMTDEEKKEFDKVLKSCNDKVFACPEKERRYKFFDAEQEDFMNAHYFDYRIVPSTGKTLIESGVALRAPEGMYKTV